jgi:hypothetical protein
LGLPPSNPNTPCPPLRLKSTSKDPHPALTARRKKHVDNASEADDKNISPFLTVFLVGVFFLIGVFLVKWQLHRLAKTLRSKLRPWWKAIKDPFVQIAASVGVLLSGVVVSLGASVGLLATGLFGVVDRALGVVGLGGMREKAFRSLGLYKVIDGVEGVFSTLGLGGVFADDDEEPNTVGNTVGATVNDVGEVVTGKKLL